MDPDPHHDGYMFTAARAVSSGLRVHGEVFYQYGPVTAWLHGAVLRVFGEHLLVLRFFSVAAILTAIAFSYCVARRVYSSATALIATTMWIGLASFLSKDFPPLARSPVCQRVPSASLRLSACYYSNPIEDE